MHGLEQLVIILIVGAVAFIKWAISQSNEENNETPIERAPRPTAMNAPRRFTSEAAKESEEERMRKFLEALGIPQTSPPPKKITRPEQAPPIPKRSSPPTPSAKKPAPKKEVQPIPTPPAMQEMPEMPEPTPSFSDELPPVLPVLAMAETQVPTSQPSAKPTSVEFGGIRDLLKAPDSLRKAVVLREILGPPKAMQRG